MHSQSLRIPVELIFTVIDNLHDDTDSLKSFALTAKTFLCPSQAHLFNCFQCLLRPAKELAQDSILVQQKYYRLNLYLSTSPRLASHIKHLVLYRANASHSAWKHVEPILLDIILRLSNVTHVTLQIFDWEFISDGLRAILRWLMRQPSLKNISFQECQFTSLSTLTSLIFESTHLMHLDADVLTFAPNQHQDLRVLDTSLGSRGREKLSLASFSLGHQSSSLAQSLLPNMRKLLALTLTRKANYAVMAKIPLLHLKTLTVAVCGGHGNTLPLEFLDPIYMPQLRHLRLTDVLESEGSSSVLGMMVFLNKITTVCYALRSVHIALHVNSPLGTLTWPHWVYMDRALASHIELCKVHISVAGDTDEDELLRLAGVLPMLRRRRILWIETKVWC